jgi:RNA polymerase sigma-70 factor, ECF subfamily
MQLRMRRKDVPVHVDDGAVAANLNDLRVLYDLHGAEIFRFCHRIVDDRGLAEEATQETFLRAWKSRDRWDGGVASVRTWLFSIARNVCIDLLRARNIRPGLSASKDDGGDSQGFDDPAYDAFLEGSMLEEGLRRIKPEQRTAIVETYLKGRPYPEVAAELEVPEATLRTRVFYGLKALRRALEEMGWNG